MTTERTTRWVVLSALALASMAVGLSLGAGCRRDLEMRPERGTAARTEAPGAPLPTPAPSPNTPSAPLGQSSDSPSAPVVAPKNDKPAPKAVAVAPLTEAGLKVRRLVVARRIEGREPAESGTRFAPDGSPLFAFVEMENASPDTQQIVVTFEQAGSPSLGNVKLDVPGNNPRYRTWGQTRRIRSTGAWQAIVRTPSGQELARQSFEVQG